MEMFDTKPCMTLRAAQKMMAAAEAEARKNNWNMAIAIVDSGGHLVMFQKLDDTQLGGVEVAIGKARTALNFKRPTRNLEEMIAKGRTGFLAVNGLVPLQGGLPVLANGVVVGAIGVSGGTSAQDEEVALAAIHAVQG